MTCSLPGNYVPRHCKLAAEVLTKLAKELESQGYKYREDPYWPYHLLVLTSGDRYLSFYCGGFRKSIDIQQMRKDGTADTRFKEECFATTKGAVNYLGRRK